MTRGQFDGIIKHIEKNLDGQGYYVEVYTATEMFCGPLKACIAGRGDTVIVADEDHKQPDRFIDVSAITVVRGPIL